MNFYDFLKQQYEDYKIETDIIFSTCDGCPCKTLRDKVFGSHNRTGCEDEITYLIDKYKIDDANIYSCYGCALAAVKIAKKIIERNNRI